MYSVLLGSCNLGTYKIEFRQDLATLDIRGYRYINDQVEPSGYPLKKRDFRNLSSNAIDGIASLLREGFEPTINAKGKIEWIKDQSASFDRYSKDSNSNPSSASSSSPIDRGSSSTVNDSQDSVNPPLPTTHKADPQLAIRPLLPLAENPLRRTHPLGFPLGASGTDYNKKYPKWCENVLTSPTIYGASYEEEIKRCEQEMGLENCRRELEPKEKRWKGAIDRALKIILEQPEVNLKNLKQIYSQFRTIYDNVYQHIFVQLQNVQNLMNDKHIFLSYFQMDFYHELKDVFPERDAVPFNNIRLKIFKSQIQTNEEASSSEIKMLQQTYPDSVEKIEELASLAKAFVQRKRNELNEKINDYLCWPEVSSCWKLIFNRCPDLQDKYLLMKQGSFSSPVEMSFGRQADFFKDPYTILFSHIVAACERFAVSPQKGTDELNQLKQEIEEIYGLRQKKLDHFDRRIEPIVFLRDVIQIILQWPGEYELSEGEKHYLSNAIYSLIFISNKSLTGEPKIPYKFQYIHEQDRAEAVRILASDKKTAQKREACRLLLYSRIPWKALLSIGSLFHGSGGIKPETIKYNRKLLGDALIDLFSELAIVEQTMKDLIDFELSEFSETPPPSPQPPTALPEDCFKYINLLGNRQQIINNLNEIYSILQWWKTTTLDANQANEIRVKYAVLRTIQMVGELSKNLRQAGLFNVNDSASRCIEQLRDLLAHLEKFKVNRRLQALLTMDNLPGCHFGSIIEDFRELFDYFKPLRREVSYASEWLEIKHLQNVDQASPNLEIKSLRTLVVYLDSHISIEEQTTLRMVVMGEDAINKRREANLIKEEFLSAQYDRKSCEEKIKKLPLTILKKKALLSGIQTLSNPRHYYRRGAHFRSGETDPRMLNTIKKYADNKKTPDDEKALFRNLSEKLSESRAYPSPEGGSSNEQLSPRIQDAQQQFSVIITLKRDRGTCVPELENVEARFIELTETFDGFIQRKKREVESILRSFDTYKDHSNIDHEVTRLIERMESNSISLDELCHSIHALGVDGDVRWQETCRQYGLRLAKGAAPAAKSAKKNKVPFDLAKMKWSITSILEILDQLHDFLTEDRDAYHHDKTLQLTCQFLYSSFRGRAITLEYGIEFLKSILPGHRHQLNTIQEILNRVIDQANGVLHVHVAAEVSTLTSFGQAFAEGFFLDQLAKDTSIGKDRQFTINSLRTELRVLLEFIESPENASVWSSSS